MFSHLAKRSVPLLAEASGEWAFEELVHWESEFATLLHSVLAHIPSVVVECHGTIGEAFLADGVEGAGDRLDERGLASAVRTLKSTT